jgi:hypothetical protein
MRLKAETARGFRGCADKDDIAVASEQVDIVLMSWTGGDGVENKSKLPARSAPSVVCGEEIPVGTGSASSFLAR